MSVSDPPSRPSHLPEAPVLTPPSWWLGSRHMNLQGTQTSSPWQGRAGSLQRSCHNVDKWPERVTPAHNDTDYPISALEGTGWGPRPCPSAGRHRTREGRWVWKPAPPPTPVTEHHTLQEGSDLQGGHAGLTVGGPWTGRKAGPFERRSECVGEQSGRQHPGPGRRRGPRGEDWEASLGAPSCSHLPPALPAGSAGSP